jgi:imidazolonepropionase-like amidohydrolase
MPSTHAFAALAILAASYATTLAATRAPLHTGSRIVIRHATVIAGTDAPPARDITVVVQNGRITDIAPASRGVSESRSGYTTRSVDARGRYLIPGLWDMHAHLDDVEMLPLNAPDSAKALQLPLFVLEGVTGVRDMGGRLEVLSRWRDSIAAGQLVGPRIVACGPLLDGAPPFWPGSIGIQDVLP